MIVVLVVLTTMLGTQQDRFLSEIFGDLNSREPVKFPLWTYAWTSHGFWGLSLRFWSGTRQFQLSN